MSLIIIRVWKIIDRWYILLDNVGVPCHDGRELMRLWHGKALVAADGY